MGTVKKRKRKKPKKKILKLIKTRGLGEQQIVELGPGRLAS